MSFFKCKIEKLLGKETKVKKYTTSCTVSYKKHKIAVQYEDMIQTDQIYRRNPYLEISFSGNVEIRERGMMRLNGTREKYTQYHVGEIN